MYLCLKQGIIIQWIIIFSLLEFMNYLKVIFTFRLWISNLDGIDIFRSFRAVSLLHEGWAITVLSTANVISLVNFAPSALVISISNRATWSLGFSLKIC